MGGTTGAGRVNARALRWVLPPLAGAAFFAWASPAYAHLLAAGSEWSRGWIPPAEAPLAVQVIDGTIRVVARSETRTIQAVGIAWNLPVLACLWAWAIGRRWFVLAGIAAGFVVVHIAIADLEIRIQTDLLSGLPYSIVRAWTLFGAALLPVACVGFAWALTRPPVSDALPGPRLPPR